MVRRNILRSALHSTCWRASEAPAWGRFIIDSDDAAIAKVINKGRSGETKKYKDIIYPMRPRKLTDEEVKAVIAHIRGLAKK